MFLGCLNVCCGQPGKSQVDVTDNFLHWLKIGKEGNTVKILNSLNVDGSEQVLTLREFDFMPAGSAEVTMRNFKVNDLKVDIKLELCTTRAALLAFCKAKIEAARAKGLEDKGIFAKALNTVWKTRPEKKEIATSDDESTTKGPGLLQAVKNKLGVKPATASVPEGSVYTDAEGAHVTTLQSTEEDKSSKRSGGFGCFGGCKDDRRKKRKEKKKKRRKKKKGDEVDGTTTDASGMNSGNGVNSGNGLNSGNGMYSGNGLNSGNGMNSGMTSGSGMRTVTGSESESQATENTGGFLQAVKSKIGMSSTTGSSMDDEWTDESEGEIVRSDVEASDSDTAGPKKRWFKQRLDAAKETVGTAKNAALEKLKFKSAPQEEEDEEEVAAAMEELTEKADTKKKMLEKVAEGYVVIDCDKTLAVSSAIDVVITDMNIKTHTMWLDTVLKQKRVRLHIQEAISKAISKKISEKIDAKLRLITDKMSICGYSSEVPVDAHLQEQLIKK